VGKTLDLQLRPPIAEVTLTRAIDDAVLSELADAMSRIADDDSVRVVLLTASAGVLSGGCTNAPIVGGAALRQIEMMPQPVIAVIEGGADGAGLALALACDMRVATQDAGFAFTGVGPSLGVTQRLPRLIGRARTAQMLLAGERIDAATALAWGLVNVVTPRGGANAEAGRIAAAICERGPLAVRYAKEAVVRGLDMPLDQALRYETDLTVILQTTSDRAEGVRAFLEKRAPRFEGK
jgi:enoyl-CoA hydratase/carnithine racemase